MRFGGRRLWRSYVYLPLSTLLVIVVFAFMLGMLTSFVMVVQALLRLKK